MPARERQRSHEHIFGQVLARQRYAPVERRHCSSHVQHRGSGNAGFRNLAGEVYVHAQFTAQRRSFMHDAQSAELDCFEAHAGGCSRGMVLVDVGQTVHAFVATDRDAGGRRNFRHAGEILRGNGLLQKIKRRVLDRAQVFQRLRNAPVLIGVRRDQYVFAQCRTHFARARYVSAYRAGTDLYFISDIPFALAARGLGDIGFDVARSNHAQCRNTAAPLAAEQFVDRFAEQLTERIMRGHFNRGLGA